MCLNKLHMPAALKLFYKDVVSQLSQHVTVAEISTISSNLTDKNRLVPPSGKCFYVLMHFDLSAALQA